MTAENRWKNSNPSARKSPAGEFPWMVSVGQGRTAVELSALPQGADWLLQITGGEVHVGAVATVAGQSVELAVVGSHKEGPLAEMCAVRWARLTGRVCVAVAGIHQDRATGGEIEHMVENVRQGLEILVKRWQEAGCGTEPGQ